MKARYEKSEYKNFANSTFEIDATTNYVDNKDLVWKGPKAEPKGRHVQGCLADNMRLPFESDFFDVYIAVMSLMLVPDHKQ